MNRIGIACGSVRAMSLVIAIAGTGCASVQSPSRPAYTTVDTVSEVTPAQLVGTWTATELNPIAGSEPESTVIKYSDDGLVSSTITLQLGTATQPDDIAFELNGQWRINGDTVTHYDMQISSIDDSEAGSILSQLINDQTKHSEQGGLLGEATVVEASVDRLVMIGTDGVAMEYVRNMEN